MQSVPMRRDTFGDYTLYHGPASAIATKTCDAAPPSYYKGMVPTVNQAESVASQIAL